MDAQLSEVSDRIIDHVEQRLGRPVKGPVTPKSSLAHDLHLDSMESVNLLADLEDHYGVTMPVQMFQRASTLGDVARAVVDALQASSGRVSE